MIATRVRRPGRVLRSVVVASVVALAPTAVASPATAARPPAPKADPSNKLFDPSFVHQVTFEVASADMGVLADASDQRVPATLTIEGITVERAGLRLKRGGISFQPLDKKSGFNVKVDAFVKNQSIFGVDRFTLGNEIWDGSFVSEHVTYEVFRKAGIPAPRTVLASVTLNGERFGLYVLREAYDKQFLERNFSEAGGNLYEAPAGSDMSDLRLELHTNEKRNDKRDIAALKHIVDSTPDDQYKKALGKVVDLRELFTYWAAEALTAHLDSYVSVTNVPFGNTDPSIVMGNTSPNNHHTYHDPARGRFPVLPWGADWALGNWLWVLQFSGHRPDLPRSREPGRRARPYALRTEVGGDDGGATRASAGDRRPAPEGDPRRARPDVGRSLTAGACGPVREPRAGRWPAGNPRGPHARRVRARVRRASSVHRGAARGGPRRAGVRGGMSGGSASPNATRRQRNAPP
jgi:hypothetical protein